METVWSLIDIAARVSSAFWGFISDPGTTNVVIATSAVFTAVATVMLAIFNRTYLRLFRQQSRDSLLSSMIAEQRQKEEACETLLSALGTLKNDAGGWVDRNIFNDVAKGQLPAGPAF